MLYYNNGVSRTLPMPHLHAVPSRPSASLLRMSAALRLCLAGLPVACIWLGVYWAMA
jgi:hypothetical protein